MSNGQDFANNLFLLMEETFEAKHHGIYLDNGKSLFETLEKFPDFVARFDVGGSALHEPLKPTGYRGIGTRVSIVRHRNYFIE